MVGYGVDIYAPRVPFVTTTILVKRPLARVWRYVAWMLGDIEGKTMPAAFGPEHAWRPPKDIAWGQDDYAW
jgi:hypothetical protein